MDPTTCPAAYLPYLAMFTGTTIPNTATEKEARNLILYQCNLFRGTLFHIEYAIKEILGTAPFTIQERTGASGVEEAYHFNVLVGVGKSSQALINAISAAKPGGVMFSVIEVENAWISGEKTWEEVPSTIVWNGTGATEPKEGVNY